jgi:ankyrin repeat protein
MERAARTAMETNIRMLGVNHLTTLSSISSLASICNLLSRDAEAEAFQLQVLERGKRHIGLYHPIVLASMTFLVQKYQDSVRERWDDAEELQAYLVTAAEKEYGSQHPCTLDRMEDMVEIYQKQKSWKRAESLQIRVFNQRLAEFGPDHASTLRALLRLSIIFSNFGKSQDAERMLVQVIVRMKGSLGNEHADMLAALASLSILYATQGRTDEANRLGVYVYKQRIRILGVNHPDTQHWKQELPLLYINSNRPEEEDVITDLFDKIEERMTAHLPILGVRMRNLIYQRLNSAGLIEGDGDPAQEAECAAARKILLEFPDLFTATRDCEQFTRSQRLRMKNDPDGYFYSEWKAATEEEIHLSQVESVEERLRMSLHSRHPPVHMSLQMRSDYAQAPVSYNSSWDKENSQLETSRIPEINDNEDIEAVLGNKVDFDKKKMLPLTEISDECEIPNSSSKKEDQFGRYIKDLYSHSRVEADQASFRFTSHGPDVKFWEPGWRELHIAVLGDDTASVQRLLESGLAVNMEEIDEHDLRLDTGNEIVIEPLEVNSAFARLEYKNKKPPKKEKSALLRAAERGNVAIVKVLLNHGGNIKARSSSLHTALHYAAKMGNQALVQLLLGEGAPIEARDSLQQTPLHMAAAAGHQTVVQTLLDSGAKATVKDYYQQTPLFLAATSGHKEIVEIMIQQGVDIMVREIHYHQTALQQATRLGHKDIVALLLRHGATYSNENQADQWLPLRVVDLSV